VLLGNYSVLQKSPVKFLAGSATSVEGQLRSNFGKSGANRCRFFVDQTTTALKLYAVPTGSYPNVAWVLPTKAGELGTANALGLAVAGAGAAVGGVTSPASAAFTLTVADAAGQLITSGSGSASLTITTGQAALTASLNATASAAIAFDASALLGAQASGQGAATLSVTGTLTAYAVGQMQGSTVDTAALTVDAIAAGVLAAALTTPIAANIAKVNSYTVQGDGSSGNPWGP
jgi:hypothetical protein